MNEVRIRNAEGDIIRRSKNLRAIIEHNRKVVVASVHLFPAMIGTGGLLGVTWIDGSDTITDFASYTVMLAWVKARKAFAGKWREVGRISAVQP